MARPARRCDGSGRVVETPVPHLPRQRQPASHADVPGEDPGRRPGRRADQARRAGASPERAGGQPGDLYVRVRVQPHAFFGRTGHDLTLELPVTFPEAALGAKVQVPTLNGPVTMKVPAGNARRQDVPAQGQGRAQEWRARRPAGDGPRRGAAEALAGREGPAQAARGEREGVAARTPGRGDVRRWTRDVSDTTDERGGERSPRSGPSTSSAWRPSSRECTRRPCACTNARAARAEADLRQQPPVLRARHRAHPA